MDNEDEVLEGVVEETPVPGLFGGALVRVAPKIEWTAEQTIALDTIGAWKAVDVEPAAAMGLFGDGGRDLSASFIALTGAAGTGKSTLIREIVDRFYSVQLTAMTGKAALRLAECAGRGATTLHKALYYPPAPGEEVRFTRLRPPESMFVVVDESSMITPAVFADMQRWADDGVRFLLVGDSYQLPPVITGEEYKRHGDDYSVFRHVRGAQLETVMRSAGAVLQASKYVRENANLCRETIESDGGRYEFVRERTPLHRAVHDYLSDREDHLLITWRNATRMQANRAIRTLLGKDGPLPDVGEPVLIKKNGQGFMNGEIVDCGGWEDGPTIGGVRTLWMRVLNGSRILVSVDGGDREKGGEFFDGQMPWIENWRTYHIELKKNMWPEPVPVTFGYCLTAHSAQGSEAKRVTVFLDRADLNSKNFQKPTTLPNGNRVPFFARFIYTAMTRSKTHTTMIVGE